MISVSFRLRGMSCVAVRSLVHRPAALRKAVSKAVSVRALSASIIDDPGEFVDVGPTKINYKKVGSGAHNVLLLPGACGSWRTDFGPTLAGFDREQFTLIGWDPPGYGRSGGDRRFDLNMFHDDARVAHQLMQRLGLTRYSLLGWSDGANTAVHMAHQQQHCLQRMLIWGGNAYVTHEDVQIYEGIRDISAWSARMREPMVSMYGEQKFAEMWEKWTDLYTKKFYIDNETNLYRELLAAIQIPTLIVHGVKDVVVPQAHADYLHANIRGSRLLNVPAGHNLHLKLADQFNRLAADWLTGKPLPAKL